MADNKKISVAVIKRLPRYYRYLGDLLNVGIVRISSKELSEKMNITASQIRQDLNNFGGFGQRGYGYNVEFLYNEIKKILGIGKEYKMIVVGAGNIGQALVNYTDFESNGFKIVGIFDVNPRLIGMTIRGIEVYDADKMETFIKNNEIDIAILTIPKTQAKATAKKLVDCGIKGIWNFSPMDLELPKSIAVENVHLTAGLMTLIYKTNAVLDK